ncbi:MAG TPA: hypothetical protein VKD72_20360, partial [Gemmataceae bacterium]|nr:hypothetical protein [Gemmataceae bacterium]
PVVGEYRGYNLVFHRRRLAAVKQSLDPVCLDFWKPADVQRYQDSGRLFLGQSLAEVKDRVNRHVFDCLKTSLRRTEALSDDLRKAPNESRRSSRRCDNDPGMFQWSVLSARCGTASAPPCPQAACVRRCSKGAHHNQALSLAARQREVGIPS